MVTCQQGGRGEHSSMCLASGKKTFTLYRKNYTVSNEVTVCKVCPVSQGEKQVFFPLTHTQTGKNILRLLQSKANHVLFFVNERMPMLYLWSTKWKEREDKQSWLRPLVHCSISRPPCPPPPPLHLSSLPFNPHTGRPHHRPILSRFPDVWPRTLH